ncbi:MAG: hypothetical protein ACI4PO_05925 [Faecousia sp.]
MWVAYILLCRDIEAACDEKVIHHMEKDEIRAYSTALLHCSVHRRRIAACPLAFGEVGVKERIKRIMNYKKPAFWIILLAVIASLVAGVLLLTNPAADPETTAPTEDVTKPSVDAALLADLTAKFSEWGSPYNMALCSDYETPDKLNLMTFFYWGFSDESQELTDAEQVLAEDFAFYDTIVELRRLPLSKMNAVLREVFGITLEEMDASAFEDLAYLEATGCYYIIAGGTCGTKDFTVTASEALEDGTIRIYYTAAYTEGHIVTLKPSDSGYRIVSNLTAQSESNGSWTHEAAITRFLTETNRSGQIASSGELVPPGTLPEVDSIPRADQALVGSTVSILFARQQQAIPFHYLRDAQSGTEHLTVVIPTDRIPLLIVFETNLGSASALCEKMTKEEPFTAKIVAFVNISFEEGMYAEMTTRYSDASDAEMVFISNPGALNGREYIGVYGTGDDGVPLSVMKGPQGASVSADLQGSLDVFYRIYERFSLTALLGTGSTNDATSPTTPSETVPDNQMTAQELAPFKAMLEEKTSYPNMALTTLYTSPQEMDLWWFFTKGTNDKPNLTDAEVAFLTAEGYRFDWNIQKQSKADLDAALMEYFGITIDESYGNGLEKFTYWAETDCFYGNYNGVEYSYATVQRGVWNSDGTVSIYYTDDWGDWEYEVRLMPKEDGGCRFLSNLPYRKLTAFSETALDHPMTAEDLAPFKAMLEEKASYPNMALLSLYESGREVDLGWLFCNSTDDKADLTDAEAAFLEAKGFNFNMAIQRQSRAELDAVMLEYFGITLAESSGKSLKAFTYWEETDCCYSNYNGVNYADIQVHHGNWNESGTVSIYYTELTSGWEMEVRLQPTNDGGYVFVYNWLNLHETK